VLAKPFAFFFQARRLLVAFCLFSVAFVGGVRAADVAVVIDDSSGMCGYMADSDSEYRRLLRRLQFALQETGASVELVRLSSLSGKRSTNAVSSGAEAKRHLDQIEKAGKCPFNLATSPLHLMHNVTGRKLTLLISDMIFDLGANGAVKSSSEFIDALERWWSTTTRGRRLNEYFNASAGLLGFRSTFRGVYFTQQGSGQMEFKSPVERPFYVFWKSADNQFSARLLRTLADREQLASGRAVALSVAPIVRTTNDFGFRPPASITSLVESGSASVIYEFANRKARFESQAKVAPQDCFQPSFASGSITITFDRRCGNDNNSRNVAFRGVRDLQNALILVRADGFGSIRRSISETPGGTTQGPILKYLYLPPNTQLLPDRVAEKDKEGKPTEKVVDNFTDGNRNCGGEAKLDCWAPRRKAEEVAKEGGDFLVIQVNRSYARLNSDSVSDARKPIFSSSWLERFEPASDDHRQKIVEAAMAGWSASKEVELCSASGACPQNSQTIGLTDFIRALAGRLDSARRSVELMNADSQANPLAVHLLWSAK